MKKKEKIVLVGLILLLVVTIVGVSYAAFSYSKRGEKVNTITTGQIVMTYTETDNIIQIDGALPTTDKTGTVQLKAGEYFDFNISSTIVGNVNINYEISAKEVGESTIAGSNIKLYLTKLNGSEEEPLMTPETYHEEAEENTYTGRPAGEMSLYKGSMNSSENNNYRLRMYVDENYNPQGDGGGLTFSVRINVYGLAGDLPTVADVLLAGVGQNGSINTTDPDQTFITGENPNNYIWYSGKLWRAVSIDPKDNSVKLITQSNISTINYNPSNNVSFSGSYMEEWLNDTSVDGFLGNLRNYEEFIKTDSIWNATQTTANTKPSQTTMVEDPVGLINAYEYTMSYSGSTFSNGYLNNGLFSWTVTPFSSSRIRTLNFVVIASDSPTNPNGVRPMINLKSTVKIAGGDGTENNPYRLSGDYDTNLSGTLLNTRYSGEYITFGIGENNLYRIVSHETNGLTKITSAEPLKDSGTFRTSAFGDNNIFSSSNTIGNFLNNEYLTNYVGNVYNNMIEENTIWYLGTIAEEDSYKLAKYTIDNTITSNTTTTKVGLLRLGELMAGQDPVMEENKIYWTLTPKDSTLVRAIFNYGVSPGSDISFKLAMKPALNLKSNVVITSGEGTKENPFQIALAN